ncbi:MAG: response regulator [Gemmatimonadota bacterium]|nr:MAG: response regulator [Gemmatimonadota bacterium]
MATRKRASLLAWAPEEAQREKVREKLIESELSALLARRLVTDAPTAGTAHLVLVAVVAVLCWGIVPAATLLPWLVLVGCSGVVRGAVGRRLTAKGAEPARTAFVVRWSVVLVAAVWTAGAVLAARWLPIEGLALLVVLFAGLVAGSTVTLLADARSFYWFTAILLGPLTVTVLVMGQSRFHLVTVMLIAVYATVMVVLYGRGHAALREHLKTVQRLARSEAVAARDRSFLDELVSSAPDAIAAVSREGRVLGVNPAFEELFGYGVAETVGRPLSELIVPDDQRERSDLIDDWVRAGRAVVTETDRRHRNGTLIPVRVSAAAAGEEAHGAILLIYDDLTAQRRAERALRDAEEQYRELVEEASDLVWQVDRDGHWTYLNQATRRIYGAAPEELLGRRFTELVDPEHVKRDQAAFRDVLRGGQSTDYETVHRDTGGRTRHLSIASRPVRDATGAVVGARGIARDVSERVAAREALEAAREAAERAVEAKSAFLATMSHEIRTPMNGVLGMLELLLDGDLSAEARRSAELARSAAESLLAVINDVLDFSKIEAGQVELEETTFDLPALVTSVVRLLAVNASAKGVDLACDLRPDVPHAVRGDPGRLRQVLSNLVGNAIKFTPSGEVVVLVELDGAEDGKAVTRFTVSDTGVGIAPDKLERVFEDFTQADVSTARKYGGTGLGLAISQRLVRLMGGEIEAISAEGHGSEFTFALALPVATERVGAPEPSELEVLKGVRALVVDDNPTHRRVVSEILVPAGVALDEVAGARAGLESLRQARADGKAYDLAIIDAYMPGQDGFELAQTVREDPDLGDTRLMMLTSAGQRGDGQRCRDLGIEAYLTKPASRLELLEAAAAVMAGHASESGRDLITRYSIRKTRARLRVLLAEDNPVNREVAAAMLRRRGHEVVTVTNGVEAVAAVRGQQYDVVLMDVEMPEMDGVQATREIRSDPNLGELPIVAVTAHVMTSERERCGAAGMTGFVVKPFKPYELFAAVEGWELGDAVPVSGPPPAAPVDLDGLREMMREAGAEDAVEAMLKVYQQDAPGRMKAIEAAVAAREGEEIKQAAHAYKSAAGTIMARKLAELLQALEDAGAADDAAAAAKLMAKLRHEHQAVLAQVSGTVSPSS